MRPFRRPAAALSLALILAFTGQGLAVARGMPGPGGTMVICTGDGPVMLRMGPDGTPAGPPHFCPEAALSLIQTILAAPNPPAAPPQWHRAGRLSGKAPASAVAAPVAAQARDPPRAG